MRSRSRIKYSDSTPSPLNSPTPTPSYKTSDSDRLRLRNPDNSNKLLPFCSVLTYFGVKLDRSLTFCHHFVTLLKKLLVSSRVTLLRRLAKMRCLVNTLCTAVLSLTYLTAKYCVLVWCCLVDESWMEHKLL